MKGRIVIAGVGTTAFGKLPGRDRVSLIVEATRNAIADAAIDKDVIDGVLIKVANSEPTILYGQSVATALGIQPRIGCALDQGGAANIALISYAAMAIEAGQLDVAVVAFGDNPRTGSRAVYARPRGDDAVYGFYSTAAGYALIHQAYRQAYGVSDAQFGAVPVTVRRHGAGNLNAHLQVPLKLEDYLAKPYLVDPMRRDDCCLVSDGAAAVIVMSAERAADLGIDHAVPVLGFGQGQESFDVHLRPDLLRTKAEVSGATAFEMAGLTRNDIDVAQLYDCFTITPLITLEDYGFCKRGQAAAFAADGGISMDGKLPMNTSGGLLSETGTPGLPLVVEAVRQMRGDARLQVGGNGAAIVSNQGGTMHTHATLILGRAG